MTARDNPSEARPEGADTVRIARDLQAHGLLELAREVAEKFHVTTTELLGRGRALPESRARRELWTRAYTIIPSYTRLGEIFDRDHSCIRAAILKHQGRPSRRTPCREVPRWDPCGGGDKGAYAIHAAQAAVCDPLPKAEAED